MIKNAMMSLAVVGALGTAVAAQAETTLYGSVRLAVEWVDNGVAGDPGKDSWNVADQASRLGVRGSEDLGSGLSAIYQYEFGVNAAGSSDNNPFKQRLSWVGLKGGFGAATLGRQYTVTYNAYGQYTDVFNGNITNPYSEASNTQRQSNQLIYTSPDLKGFSFASSVTANGQAAQGTDSGKNNVDQYQVGFMYSNDSLSAGIALADIRSDFDQGYEYWGIGGSYTLGDFVLSALYEDHFSLQDQAKADGFDYKGYGLVAGYNIGNNTVRAGWGRVDPSGRDANGQKLQNQDMWQFGLEHRFSKRTLVWAEYTDSEIAADGYLGAGAKLGSDSDHLMSVGMRHDF